MKYKNYWVINEDAQDDLKYTTNIHNIMDEQCQYLFQYSKGKIFAILYTFQFHTTISLPTIQYGDVILGKIFATIYMFPFQNMLYTSLVSISVGVKGKSSLPLHEPFHIQYCPSANTAVIWYAAFPQTKFHLYI